jgi:hypothetical protein
MTTRSPDPADAKANAVKSAGEKLDHLEATMRRVYYATLAAAILLGLIALEMSLAGYEYLRLKSSLAIAQAQAAAGLEQLRSDMARPPRLPRQAP